MYTQELYRVVICGQDARLIVGTAPYSMLKIAAVVAGAIAIILLILMIIAAG